MFLKLQLFLIGFLLISAQQLFAFHPQEIYKNWSLEKKIGQLFWVGYRNEKQIEAIQPSGVILFSWNCKTPQTCRALTKKISQKLSQNDSGLIPFISMDHEGGEVLRLKTGMTQFPSAAALGATRSPQNAFLVGQAMGEELAAIGVNTNLAPVLELGNARSFLQNRVFGNSPEAVTQMSAQFIRGLQSSGRYLVGKHFPGHGLASKKNIHFEGIHIERNISSLISQDTLAFQSAIQENIPAIMTAHTTIQNISPKPASISKRVIDGLLKKQLGFNGLVITDDLQMEGVFQGGKYGSTEELAIMSLLAGTDIIMIVWSEKKQKRIKQHLKRAIQSGKFPLALLHEKLDKILSHRKHYLHSDHQNPDWKKVLQKNSNLELSKRIQKKAIRWEAGDYSKILKEIKHKSKAGLTVFLPNSRAQQRWSKQRPKDRIHVLSKRASRAQIKSTLKKIDVLLTQKKAFIVVTEPIPTIHEDYYTGLRRLFNEHIQKNRGKSLAVIWVHQGLNPVKTQRRRMKEYPLGVVALHSSSSKAIQLFTSILNSKIF